MEFTRRSVPVLSIVQTMDSPEHPVCMDRSSMLHFDVLVQTSLEHDHILDRIYIYHESISLKFVSSVQSIYSALTIPSIVFQVLIPD